MRPIKMLAFAGSMALVTVAFGGTSSALANATHIVLCEGTNPKLTCLTPHDNIVHIRLRAVNPKLLTSVGTIECEESFALVTLLNELGLLLTAHLLNWYFAGNCHMGAASCTITVNELGLLSIVKKGALEATLKWTGGESFTAKCGFFINCTYGGEPTFESHSSEEGELKVLANETELEEGEGFLCPETTKFDATYTSVEENEAEEWIPMLGLTWES